AMLTMFSSLAWWNLLRFRDASSIPRMLLQASLQIALVYTHPLGLLMLVALGLGWLVDYQINKLRFRSWIAIQVVTALACAPWIANYFDHKPEFLTHNQSLKFLLGMPIGFTGGNSRTLMVLAAVILAGLVPFRIRGLTRNRAEAPQSAWPI